MKVFFTDFSGGWAPNLAPSAIAVNELRDLNNYCIGPKGELMTRPPLLRSTSSAHPAEIYHLNISSGEQTVTPWGLLVGDDGSGGDYFSFDETGTVTPLTDVDSFATLDPYPNISSVRYKDIFYVFGDGISNLFGPIDFVVRADIFADTDFQQAGITPPGAPTVAPLAGGSLPAAVYYCLVTFYNNRTGAESTIGTASAAVTTAAGNLQIAWTGIPVAAGAGTGAAQVTYRRLWRTLPNQTNEYYLVGTLPDNTTTVFTDNVSVAAMGSRASLSGRTGYVCTGGFAVWRERLWFNAVLSFSNYGTSQEALVYSQVGLLENFMLDGFLPIGSLDVSPLRGCLAADDYLLVFKALSVWRVTGTGPSNFRVDRLKSPTGLWDTYALASGPPGVFFLGSDGYFYFTAGNQVQNISDRLGKLDLHAGENIPQIQSIVWPAKNWFMTVVYSEGESCLATVIGIIGDGGLGWAQLCGVDSGTEPVQADINGNFVINNVPCGTYSITVRNEDNTEYKVEEDVLVISSGTNVGTINLTEVGEAPECEATISTNSVGSTSTIYVFDYVKNCWTYWNFSGGATRPRPRCLTIGYDVDARGPRLYVGGQTDVSAFVDYFDDDLFNSESNDTDLLMSIFGEDIADSPSAPARSIRTKDYDAKDFGLPPGSAFIVRQVLVRIGWPVSIESSTVPDGNWELEFTFKLHGDTNLTQVLGSELATTSAIQWSTEDRANDQWHAIGLSSQEHATTSVGLEIISAVDRSPRRHSITGIAFDVEGVNRHFIQPGQMLMTNIVGSITGTGGLGAAGGIIYLCPSDTSVPNDSQVLNVGGGYLFSDLPPGTYLMVITNAGNTASGTATVVVGLGENVVQNFTLDIPEGSSGCPLA